MKWLAGIPILAFASALAAQQPAMPPMGLFQQMQSQITPEQDDQLSSDVFANMSFVLLHQLGHGLPPDLTSEPLSEGDHDDFAVFVLTEAVARGEIGDIGDLAEATGTGWAALWSSYDPAVGPYWSEHGLNEQRAKRVACLLYGFDEKRFEQLPQRFGMTGEEVQECSAQYEQMRQTWQEWLAGHLRQQQDPQEIEVRFLPVQHELSMALQNYLQEEEYLEVVGETITQTLRLDRPVSIEIGECGAPTAHWDEQNRTVRMCYELVASLFTTIAPIAAPPAVETQQQPPAQPPGPSVAQQPPFPPPPHEQPGSATPPTQLPPPSATSPTTQQPQQPQYPGPRGQQPFPTSPNQPQPPQMPSTPGAPQMPPQQPGWQQHSPLAGTWAMTMQEPQSGQPMQYQLNLRPDGHYAVSVQSSQGRIDSWGTYAVHPDRIVFTLSGSNFPLAQPGTQSTMYYQQLGPNQVRVPEGVLQRMQ